MADTMSKTERQTLIRLVKQRFKLLEKGLDARRSQLRQLIREEVLKENEDKIALYQNQIKVNINEKLHDLQKEIHNNATIKNELKKRNRNLKIVRLPKYEGGSDLEGTRRIIQKVIAVHEFQKKMQRIEGKT